MPTLDNKKIYFVEVYIEHFDDERKVWDIDAYWQDLETVNIGYALDDVFPNRGAVIGYISEDGKSYEIKEPFRSIITDHWLENRHVLDTVVDKMNELRRLPRKPKDKQISLNKAVSIFRSMLREELLGTCEEMIEEYTEEFRNNFQND